eukprot:1148413-Pelagomonas_calceolata.AAC.1
MPEKAKCPQPFIQFHPCPGEGSPERKNPKLFYSHGIIMSGRCRSTSGSPSGCLWHEAGEQVNEQCEGVPGVQAWNWLKHCDD